ncbi:GRB10-interacting GYF protein 2-like [Thrips palmi]|uniref:GRB10-interacting GYF protein 2-like n=1 Tax=Thrips palmi TaxID=161013 RepID=A0A6P8YR92_THRPL|nr:GRB10-interacting GYF protein 2-like [Thrips palmi]
MAPRTWIAHKGTNEKDSARELKDGKVKKTYQIPKTSHHKEWARESPLQPKDTLTTDTDRITPLKQNNKQIKQTKTSPLAKLFEKEEEKERKVRQKQHQELLRKKKRDAEFRREQLEQREKIRKQKIQAQREREARERKEYAEKLRKEEEALSWFEDPGYTNLLGAWDSASESEIEVINLEENDSDIEEIYCTSPKTIKPSEKNPEYVKQVLECMRAQEKEMMKEIMEIEFQIKAIEKANSPQKEQQDQQPKLTAWEAAQIDTTIPSQPAQQTGIPSQKSTSLQQIKTKHDDKAIENQAGQSRKRGKSKRLRCTKCHSRGHTTSECKLTEVNEAK